METGYPNRGGWFAERHKLPAYVLALGLVVNAGTGVYADDLSQLQQHRADEAIIANPLKIKTVVTDAARSSIEDIGQIRRVMAPAMSDLARSFDVSRQTIYNWLKGVPPSPEHTAKLRDVALAADLFAEAGISVTGVLLKRKVHEGKNFFEIVRDGGSARDAAHLLLQIVRREASQRERLTARLAGRALSPASADSDLMSANDEV